MTLEARLRGIVGNAGAAGHRPSTTQVDWRKRWRGRAASSCAPARPNGHRGARLSPSSAPASCHRAATPGLVGASRARRLQRTQVLLR